MLCKQRALQHTMSVICSLMLFELDAACQLQRRHGLDRQSDQWTRTHWGILQPGSIRLSEVGDMGGGRGGGGVKGL